MLALLGSHTDSKAGAADNSAAKKSGDTAKVTEAVSAMKSSHTWKLLLEMDKQGDYPEQVWRYADQIAKGETPSEYQQGLGCD